MDKRKFVRNVVPRPSSLKILKKLEETNKVKLGCTDRDTIFVFEEEQDDVTHWSTRLPIATACDIHSQFPGNRVVKVSNVLTLNTPTTSLDVTILVPNTIRHTILADCIENPQVNFGVMNDCIFPDCKRCRRSAQCLIGDICTYVSLFGRFTKTGSTFRPGDRYNQWTFAMRRRFPMQLGTFILDNFDIWLYKTSKDRFELEFTKAAK